ncbi:HNH endonuclease [Microbacterium sp. A82]|uniref:HNH endonuclease n=1 Tax=Microbacterium sp. A82 TaxID=3450452 RepID=UPI003F39BBA2
MSRTATTAWRRIARKVRAQGRAANTPCHLCRGRLGPIDYREQRQADAEARARGEYWLVGQPRPLALDVDHLTPHAAGGKDTLENAAPSHSACNRSAGAKGATTTRKTKPVAVAGHWTPNTGTGPRLPGHALPGTRTKTHTFTAG